tara:strand:+ start:312 stop:791 length:480 start_codon:yes stop_codon:yes gene_type:complete
MGDMSQPDSTVDTEVNKSAPIEIKPGRIDLKFRHVFLPSVIAIILVSMCAFTLEYHRFPPMILALILATFCAPVLALLTKAGTIWEHAIGVGIVCLPMAGIWALGSNYFNVAIPLLVWVWQSASWSKSDHPPFRYGIWHGFGIAFSIVPGAMLYAGLFQ